jgi:hypothetical protein
MNAELGDAMTYVIAALAVVSAVQSAMLWRSIRAIKRLGRLEDGLERCTQGLSLLVDTSESGFAMIGAELARAATAPPRRDSNKATTRRIVSAARHGKPIPDIAAAEQLSEGEVRLRLHLASSGARVAAGPAGDGRDALCT